MLILVVIKEETVVTERVEAFPAWAFPSLAVQSIQPRRVKSHFVGPRNECRSFQSGYYYLYF